MRGNVTKYRFATRKKFRRSPFSPPELFPEPIRSSPWPEGRFHSQPLRQPPHPGFVTELAGPVAPSFGVIPAPMRSVGDTYAPPNRAAASWASTELSCQRGNCLIPPPQDRPLPGFYASHEYCSPRRLSRLPKLRPARGTCVRPPIGLLLVPLTVQAAVLVWK